MYWGLCLQGGEQPSGRDAPAAHGWPRLQCRVRRGEKAPLLRMELPPSPRPAVFAIDQDGRDLLRPLIKLLAPLSKRDQDREHAAALRRRHIFLIGAAV